MRLIYRIIGYNYSEGTIFIIHNDNRIKIWMPPHKDFEKLRKLIKSDRYQQINFSPSNANNKAKTVADIMIRKREDIRKATVKRPQKAKLYALILDLFSYNLNIGNENDHKETEKDIKISEQVKLIVPLKGRENKRLSRGYSRSNMFLDVCKNKNLNFISSKNVSFF